MRHLVAGSIGVATIGWLLTRLPLGRTFKLLIPGTGFPTMDQWLNYGGRALNPCHPKWCCNKASRLWWTPVRCWPKLVLVPCTRSPANFSILLTVFVRRLRQPLLGSLRMIGDFHRQPMRRFPWYGKVLSGGNYSLRNEPKLWGSRRVPFSLCRDRKAWGGSELTAVWGMVSMFSQWWPSSLWSHRFWLPKCQHHG